MERKISELRNVKELKKILRIIRLSIKVERRKKTCLKFY